MHSMYGHVQLAVWEVWVNMGKFRGDDLVTFEVDVFFLLRKMLSLNYDSVLKGHICKE